MSKLELQGMDGTDDVSQNLAFTKGNCQAGSKASNRVVWRRCVCMITHCPVCFTVWKPLTKVREAMYYISYQVVACMVGSGWLRE